jgi:hypothetical protein
MLDSEIRAGIGKRARTGLRWRGVLERLRKSNKKRKKKMSDITLLLLLLLLLLLRASKPTQDRDETTRNVYPQT